MANHNVNDKTIKLLSSLKDKEKVRVLFVCLGNICRSPAAEGVMRSIVDEAGAEGRFELDSAGTGRYHIGQLPDQRMRVHARRRGLELTHHCRQVESGDFDRFDLILAMDGANLRDLKMMAPTVEGADKVVAMGEFIDLAGGYYDHVPDPYYEGAEGFELVLDLLENGCRNLFNSLTRNR